MSAATTSFRRGRHIVEELSTTMDHDQAQVTWDTRVRCHVYDYVMREGTPPSAAAAAAALGHSTEEVTAAFRRLADARILVLQHDTGEILMANPFSAGPTPFQVHAGGRTFFGNCIWDAFGIFAMLRHDGRLDTSCGCCGTAMQLTVTRGMLDPGEGIAHFGIPAAHWWDDIVFN